MAYLHPRDPRMIAFAAATAKDGRNAEAINFSQAPLLWGDPPMVPTCPHPSPIQRKETNSFNRIKVPSSTQLTVSKTTKFNLMLLPNLSSRDDPKTPRLS